MRHQARDVSYGDAAFHISVSDLVDFMVDLGQDTFLHDLWHSVAACSLAVLSKNLQQLEECEDRYMP